MEEKKVRTTAAESDPLSLVADGDSSTVDGGNAEADMAEKSSSTEAAERCNDNIAFDNLKLGLPARYNQLRFSGDGGMSVVYRAIDTEDGDKPVALKLLKEELSRDASVVERFQREVAAMKTLTHQNIVHIFDSGVTTTGIPYFVSEYVDGGTLEEATRREGHLPVERSRRIILQICKALEFAHARGIVHRDIKPSNILLCHDAEGNEVAKLADFGIAKPPSTEPLFNTDLTRTGMILGSPAYMSPEQCRGYSVDERSDIYSLGCVMYETLTGSSPFAAENPIKAIIRHLDESPQPFAVSHIKLGIPSGLEEVVMKCLEKEPKDRFQTSSQLLKTLSSPVVPEASRRMAAFMIDLWIFMFSFGLIMQLPLPMLQKEWSFEMYLLLLLYPLYFAGFESSRLGATPAKLMLGLRVRDKDGLRLDFLTAFLFPLFAISMVLLVLFAPILFLFSLPIDQHPISAALQPLILPVLALCCLLAWFIDNRTRCEGKPITTGQTAPTRRVREKISAIVLIALLPILATLGVPELAAYIADSGDIPVVAANRPIEPRHRIEEKDVRLFHMPHYLPLVPSTVRSKEEVVGKIAEIGIGRRCPIVQEEVLPPALEKAHYFRHAGVIGVYPTVTAIYDPATGEKMTPENATELLGKQSKNLERWRASADYNSWAKPLNLPADLR
jgi:serine/threonine protein kinase